jgi:hypothetical protein
MWITSQVPSHEHSFVIDMWHELLERWGTYLDGKDVATAIVAAFVLFMANQVRRWVMSRRNKLAAGIALTIVVVLVVLSVWKYAVVMNAVATVFKFKVNIWILVGAYALLTILAGPWFIKNIHKIAAEVGGARNEVFIQEGKPLLDKPFNWMAQSDPSNKAHGAFKVIQLHDNQFYELECTVEYSPAASPKLCFGILLMSEPIVEVPDFRHLSSTDVYSGVDLFTEGLKARIIEGVAKRAFRKDVQPSWRTTEEGLRCVHLRFVINDGCHLALLVDGQFMFAKPIHKEALKNLALFVHTRPSASFQASMRDIVVRVAKTEFDLLMERRPKQIAR